MKPKAPTEPEDGLLKTTLEPSWETRGTWKKFFFGNICVEGISQEVRPNDLWGCFLRYLLRVILGYVRNILYVVSFPWNADGATDPSFLKSQPLSNRDSGSLQLVGGKNVNHPMLSNGQNLLRLCFAENTGQRPDLKFGDMCAFQLQELRIEPVLSQAEHSYD